MRHRFVMLTRSLLLQSNPSLCPLNAKATATATAAATTASSSSTLFISSFAARLSLRHGSTRPGSLSLVRGRSRAPCSRRWAALPEPRAHLPSRGRLEGAVSATRSSLGGKVNSEKMAKDDLTTAAATAAGAAATAEATTTAVPAAKRHRAEGAGGANDAVPAPPVTPLDARQNNDSNNKNNNNNSGNTKRRRGGGGPSASSSRPQTPELALRLSVHSAARAQDPRAALEAFDCYVEKLEKEAEAAKAAAEAGATSTTETKEPSPSPPSSLIYVPADVRNSLLYLCAGGDAWDSELAGPQASQARRRLASGPNSSALANAAAAEQQQQEQQDQQKISFEELARRGREIFDRTTTTTAAGSAPPNKKRPQQQQNQQQHQPLSKDGEMAFTALARMAARAGDPEGSLAAARSAVEAGYPPRLRCFSPAILAFAARADAASAFAVEQEASTEHGIEMTEAELRVLTSAAAAANQNADEGDGVAPSEAKTVPFERVEASVLTALTREHGRLQPETIAALGAYFGSLGGGGEPSEPSSWSVGRARVDPLTGSVAFPESMTTRSPASTPATKTGATTTSPRTLSDNLQPVDLEPHEWSAFSEGVASLARSRERAPLGDFDAFAQWCERKGPFDAVVDGANVALFGQNWEHGGFSFAQIEAVVTELKKVLGPGSKTLVVLHRSRLSSPLAREPVGRRVLNSLRENHSSSSSSSSAILYSAPHGSNDDWYWLHAAVAAGEKGLVVSNDEMRDHVFQLLSPRFASRWKDRHQVRYDFLFTGTQGNSGSATQDVSAKLVLPPPFSECSQRLPRTGAWLFPRKVVVDDDEDDESGGNDGDDDDNDDRNEWLCCFPSSSLSF